MPEVVHTTRVWFCYVLLPWQNVPLFHLQQMVCMRVKIKKMIKDDIPE